MLGFANNTTINDLVREGDTDRLEKSVADASQVVDELTTSKKASQEKILPPKRTEKTSSTNLKANEDVEIEESSSGDLALE